MVLYWCAREHFLTVYVIIILFISRFLRILGSSVINILPFIFWFAKLFFSISEIFFWLDIGFIIFLVKTLFYAFLSIIFVRRLVIVICFSLVLIFKIFSIFWDSFFDIFERFRIFIDGSLWEVIPSTFNRQVILFLIRCGMIEQMLISGKSLSIFGVFASRFIIPLILSIPVLFFSFVFMFLSCSLIVVHKISSREGVGFILGL